ncbi:MAG: hypothetical protein K9K67_08180 [Bacteriovoracaceae bacterium]|nr:hypothetical protein [Bacteriovoracaceae bacterium]
MTMEILATFDEALRCYNQNKLAPARMGVVAFLCLGEYFHGKGFVQSKKARLGLDEITRLSSLELANYLEFTRFKRIKSKVSRALAKWTLGEWQLELLQHVPSVYEVLSLQASSRRCVTLYCDPDRWNGPKLNKENALHFLVHDLEHAVQFFDYFHDEQVDLNRKLLSLYDEGHFADIRSPELKERLDYLLSDMNTHPNHSIQYLKAIWIDHFKVTSTSSLDSLVNFKMREFQNTM